MLQLYQFELSHHCEKIRLILDYKGLDYRKVEVTPGIGQLELYQMSGQRQVPVLKDGSQIVVDSTAIARYLERQYPNPPLIPTDPKQRGLCLLMEEWADESIALKSRKVAFGALSQDPDFRKSFLPVNTPDLVRSLVEAVPSDFLNILGLGVGASPSAVKTAKDAIEQDLEALSLLLTESPYLVTDRPTLADFAVAGLTMYLKIPDGPYLDIPAKLRGTGIPEIINNPVYEVFFNWRQRLYAQYRKPLTSPQSGPTSINID